MSKSEKIRELAKSGMSTAEIARTLGIRYQFAYGVLHAARTSVGDRPISNAVSAAAKPSKPPLLVSDLRTAGFEHVGSWILSAEQRLVLDRELPKAVGVYAFAKGDAVLYVGVATMGLAKRLYFYGRPGVSQRTSLRINAIIIDELARHPKIDVYAAFPPDLEWNGLPVHGSAGLELGLIKKFALPWNMRSAGQ
ncbi:GIY-YIG nuclease family protein [Mesorhizobium sp. M2E.F.Ca.ET.209.01.1.1]|uniref:GIY-YIG nuclease family protein n=1 Tax=Mesorhizobium sp. M2E.F.Ca.ET.209.01.1.1 TaxID=2500526 RepID=UPI000FD73447|nr:GIY-YIG nuclease family protein [Mesorhizobium sp. M2E.F.Ca.ET.209.01.1.1]TGS19045.1 GIY-YIG nuclease family protein [Mesorhizobium sp. M2E.F.Ca.ET.209.01.1.1]